MAGRGSRLRPHTITVPKPLISFSGKPMVQRMAEDLARGTSQQFDEIAFIIGDFGKEAEEMLYAVGEQLQTKVSIYYQEKPLGTAHAIYCAADSLNGPVMVAFADTLFRGSFKINDEDEGIIWAKRVEDPSAYGVLKLDGAGFIEGFVEKPATFISDLAIVGIYYFKDGAALKSEIKYLLDNNIKEKGEFQLTNALQSLQDKGVKFRPGEIDAWLDCGNKDALLTANTDVLQHLPENALRNGEQKIINSVIIEPCFIDNGVEISNSVIGPYVSIGRNTTINRSVVSNSILQQGVVMQNVICDATMAGSFAELHQNPKNWSVGDFTKILE